MKITAGISILISLMIISMPFSSKSQVYTNKEIGKKALSQDSLAKKEYTYMLPIWGKKAAAKGFNLPYPAGISLNYFGQKSDIVIDNLKVGFNNGELYDMDDLIRFDKAVSTANALSIRPDFWLFPFLNVYGIFGRSSASTDVGFGVWIPDSTNAYREIMHDETKVEFTATTCGFGLTPTIGIGGGWLALDMNFTWTDVPQLNKPAFAFVFGPRLGKTFKFKKPDCNIAFWVGGFRVNLKSGTEGSVNLADVMPISEWETQINNSFQQIADAQQQVDSWWSGLSSTEQRNPVNIAKHEAANKALQKAGDIMNAAGEAVETAGTSSVQYSMDKRPKDKWNFIVGSQFQLNKHWMLRAEAGFLSSRTQVTAGLQYRFGL